MAISIAEIMKRKGKLLSGEAESLAQSEVANKSPLRGIIFLVHEASEASAVDSLKARLPTGYRLVIKSWRYSNQFSATEFIATVRSVKKAAPDVPCYLLTSFDSILKYVIAETQLNLLGKEDFSSFTWQGSVFSTVFKGEVDKLMILPHLRSIYTIPSMGFLLRRYVNKLFLANKLAIVAPEFRWSVLEAGTAGEEFVRSLADAKIIASDIETMEHKWQIKCCSVSVLYNSGVVRTVCIPLSFADSLAGYADNLDLLRKIMNTPVQKIFQNGKYDVLYLMRWDCTPVNFCWDTYVLQHCLFSELDRDLASLSAFYLPDHVYWKDERNVQDNQVHMAYCCKDAHRTLFVLLSQLQFIAQNPKHRYAMDNYALEFRLLMPSLQCEAEGMRVDEERRLEVNKELKHIAAELKRELEEMVKPDFNPASPKQVKALFNALGLGKVVEKYGCDAKGFDMLSSAHPMGALFCDVISRYRKSMKLLSNYVDIGEDGKDKIVANSIFYSIDPAGTDTSRMACKASSFWCGYQMQNVPRDAAKVKSYLVADDGYLLGENDMSQSEARGVAYLSDCPSYIEAVEESPDFHLWNASLFFGIPFEELWLDGKGKKVNASLRDLAKRVNHGSNYNMGALVLLVTMGITNVVKAQLLLRLPSHLSQLQVCEYLLGRFVFTYPEIKSKWYKELVSEWNQTRMLRLPSVVPGFDGWVRYFFADPNKSKSALNALVAHKPQALSVQTVNNAFYNCWAKYQSVEFRIKAQIHDSILYQAKEALFHKYSEIVKQEMEQRILMPSGKTLFVPVDAPDKGGKRWSDLK